MIKYVLHYILYFVVMLVIGVLANQGRYPVEHIILMALVVGILLPLSFEGLGLFFKSRRSSSPSFGHRYARSKGYGKGNRSGWRDTIGLILSLVAISVIILAGVGAAIGLGYFICVIIPTFLIIGVVGLMAMGGGK